MHKISKPTKRTLLFISMTTMMSNVAIVTTLPHLKEYFTATQYIDLLSRLMITLPSLSIALLAPFLGHIIHVAGRKNAAVSALFLFAVTGSAGLYLETMNLLLLSRALLGVAIAVLMIVSTSLVGDYFKGESRHRFMGLQSAFVAVGGVVFVVGGGVLSDLNWRYPFGIYLIGFLLIPFVAKFLVEYGKDSDDTLEENLNPNLLGIYFLAFLLMLIFYILPTQIPFLIINHFGASGTVTGAVISLAFVFNALGALAFAKLKRRFSFEAIYLIGMGIISIGFVLIGLVEHVRYFFFTSPLMGFGGGILMTNVAAWMLHKAHHTKRVKASGYLTSSLFMGQFFSPIVFYPLVDSFGVQHFFIAVGVMIAVVSAFAGVLTIRASTKK